MWTDEGQKRARLALYKKYGGEEGYRAEMRRRASLGGKKGGGKGGFTTMRPDVLIKVSAKGGSAKRRAKK